MPAGAARALEAHDLNLEQQDGRRGGVPAVAPNASAFGLSVAFDFSVVGTLLPALLLAVALVLPGQAAFVPAVIAVVLAIAAVSLPVVLAVVTAFLAIGLRQHQAHCAG
jgi:hypothetical protein